MHRRFLTIIARRVTAVIAVSMTLLALARAAQAQTAPVTAPQAPTAPMERVTFDEAVRRALERNPTIAEAATNILRAEALLERSRAATLPNVSASFTNVLIDGSRGFEGTVTQPRNQAFLGVSAGMPVLASAQWAATQQARDQVEVAKLSTNDVRRQIAIAAGQAYLAIINASRQVDVQSQARDAGQAHLDYAQRRLADGAGSRINELRAAQQVSADEARVETARFAMRSAQEALGVLLAANAPVDANGEPAFDVPPTAEGDAWMSARTDIQLFTASLDAANRVVKDSTKDWFPTVHVSFDPQFVKPAGAFSPSGSWSFSVVASQPIFDGGDRRGLKRLREAAVESAKQQLTATQIQARSEARLELDNLRSAERVLASLQLSSGQAEEVVRISTVAFEAGATTNLELIDAQRTARDAESAVAIAEDAVRRAKLDLLAALGRFPQLP